MFCNVIVCSNGHRFDIFRRCSVFLSALTATVIFGRDVLLCYIGIYDHRYSRPRCYLWPGWLVMLSAVLTTVIGNNDHRFFRKCFVMLLQSNSFDCRLLALLWLSSQGIQFRPISPPIVSRLAISSVWLIIYIVIPATRILSCPLSNP